MFLLLAAIVVVAWLMGFAVFHVAGGAIHLLLFLAIVAVIVHFVRGGRAGAGTATPR
jgi:hypothetical protein